MLDLDIFTLLSSSLCAIIRDAAGAVKASLTPESAADTERNGRVVSGSLSAGDHNPNWELSWITWTI